MKVEKVSLSSFFLLGRSLLQPVDPEFEGFLSTAFCALLALLVLKYSSSRDFAGMPFTNGDVGTSTAQLMPGKSAMDFNTALDVLNDEEKDGIDAKTLLDSKLNGGLTYNDFLVLPGYIGTLPTGHTSLYARLTILTRVCCLGGGS